MAPPRGEVYFEFITLANAVKVNAVDADTGTEVSIFGPRSTAQGELERIALAKLDYVLRRAAKPGK
jgi:hypothetical protein